MKDDTEIESPPMPPKRKWKGKVRVKNIERRCEMNIQLQEFAREKIKEGLAQCTEGEQEKFKRMYAGGKLELSINDVVNSMQAEKLEWAMEQIKRTLAKRTFAERQKKQNNLRKIVEKWLKEYEYDGLYNDTNDCVCSIDNLMLCGNPSIDCLAGYEFGTSDCGCDVDFHIGAEKKCSGPS